MNERSFQNSTYKDFNKYWDCVAEKLSTETELLLHVFHVARMNSKCWSCSRGKIKFGYQSRTAYSLQFNLFCVSSTFDSKIWFSFSFSFKKLHSNCRINFSAIFNMRTELQFFRFPITRDSKLEDFSSISDEICWKSVSYVVRSKHQTRFMYNKKWQNIHGIPEEDKKKTFLLYSHYMTYRSTQMYVRVI